MGWQLHQCKTTAEAYDLVEALTYGLTAAGALQISGGLRSVVYLKTHRYS